MKPSSRSINPPWPGMRRLASFAPKRRLTADFEQVAGLRQDRQNTRHYPNDPQLTDPARIGDRDARGNPPGETADGAGPSLLRADARPQQRPADRPPAEIGEYVGRPDHCEQEQKRDEPPSRIAAQHHRRDQQGAGIDHPAGGPGRRRWLVGRPRQGGDDGTRNDRPDRRRAHAASRQAQSDQHHRPQKGEPSRGQDARIGAMRSERYHSQRMPPAATAQSAQKIQPPT